MKKVVYIDNVYSVVSCKLLLDDTFYTRKKGTFSSRHINRDSIIIYDSWKYY